MNRVGSIVTDHDWVGLVTDCMHNLCCEFKVNELAYLALTSKVERPVVDRLAYSLQRQYGDDERVGIAREFTASDNRKRVDLAVIADNKPVLYLEAKAMGYYHMYMGNAGTKYPDKVRGDICKMKKYRSNDTRPELRCLALLLTTYIQGMPKTNLASVVKYTENIRRHRVNDRGDMKRKIEEYFPESCFPLVDSGAGDISGGRAFGMDVFVHFRLLGPY